jgi:hypothetical protein
LVTVNGVLKGVCLSRWKIPNDLSKGGVTQRVRYYATIQQPEKPCVVKRLMKHEFDGLNYHTINGSFYSEHPKVHGPVKVFNTLHYLMAEYCITTGIAKWHRVLPVSQRYNVEEWLGTHYPTPVAVH